jgi:hypothetical protein
MRAVVPQFDNELGFAWAETFCKGISVFGLSELRRLTFIRPPVTHYHPLRVDQRSDGGKKIMEQADKLVLEVIGQFFLQHRGTHELTDMAFERYPVMAHGVRAEVHGPDVVFELCAGEGLKVRLPSFHFFERET